MSDEDEAGLTGDISWKSVLSAPDLDPDFFAAAVGRALDSSPAEADDGLVPTPWPGGDTAGSDQPDQPDLNDLNDPDNPDDPPDLEDPDNPDDPPDLEDPDNPDTSTHLSTGGSGSTHDDRSIDEHRIDDLLTGLGSGSELGDRNGQVGASGGPDDQPLPEKCW